MAEIEHFFLGGGGGWGGKTFKKTTNHHHHRVVKVSPSTCQRSSQQQGCRSSDRLWSMSVADLGIGMHGPSLLVQCHSHLSPVFMPQRTSDALQHPACALSLFRNLYLAHVWKRQITCVYSSDILLPPLCLIKSKMNSVHWFEIIRKGLMKKHTCQLLLKSFI